MTVIGTRFETDWLSVTYHFLAQYHTNEGIERLCSEVVDYVEDIDH